MLASPNEVVGLAEDPGLLEEALAHLGCPNCWEVTSYPANLGGMHPEPCRAEVATMPNRGAEPWVDIVRAYREQKREVLVIDRPSLQLHAGNLRCACCGTQYPVSDRIVSLLPIHGCPEQDSRDKLRRFYDEDYALQNPTWHREDSLSKIRELSAVLPRGLETRSILEVGCGTGLVLSGLCDRLGACSKLGLDISRTALEMARGGVDGGLWVQADGEQLPFRTGSLDLSLNADIIEHMLVPSRSLQEQARVSRFLLAKVPIEESGYTWAQEALGVPRRAQLRRKFGHLHHFTHRQVLNLVRENGFDIKVIASSKIPNRKGITRTLQDWTFRHCTALYPLLWGGFTILFASSRAHAKAPSGAVGISDEMSSRWA